MQQFKEIRPPDNLQCNISVGLISSSARSDDLTLEDLEMKERLCNDDNKGRNIPSAFVEERINTSA
jgi:hypothetical protein